MRAGSRGQALYLILLVALLVGAQPGPARAQAGELQVTIDRPGEGESYYTGADGPRTLVPIVGRVVGGSFEPGQIEIQIELLQAGQVVGRQTMTPSDDGTFALRVLINANGSGHLSSPEENCFVCHENAALTLPDGPSTVRVSAVEPTGKRVSAERHMSLDHAAVAPTTVQVRVTDEGRQPVAGLLIEATARMYDWRSRKFTALTDDQGRAALQLEALALQPTRYRLSVAPTQVGGVLYQSAAAVDFELPAGASAAGPVEMPVEAVLGQLACTVALGQGEQLVPGRTLTARVVGLPYGRAFSAPVATGRFNLAGLPIGRYLVAVDADQAAALGLQARAVTIDFGERTNATCALELAPGTDRNVRGALRDPTGLALPFGWVTAAGHDLTAQVGPATGAFALFGLPSGVRTLQVNAPGYWSRVIPARAAGQMNVTLQPKPGTRSVAWGTGRLVLPDASLATAAGREVTLRRGWVWGSGEGPLTVTTPDAGIAINGGSFAVEYLPGESGWLYVMAGSAEITARSQATATLTGGHMCTFAGRDVSSLVPVSLDKAAIQLLSAQRTSPVAFEGEPGAATKFADALAVVGIMDAHGLLHAALGLLGAGIVACGSVLIVSKRRRRGQD